VYRFLRAMQQRRLQAALTLQRRILTLLTRRWFDFRNLPGFIEWNGIVTYDRLFWPRAVVMQVSYYALRHARPGSIILGMPVTEGSAWQHLLYVAVYWREDVWALQCVSRARCVSLGRSPPEVARPLGKGMNTHCVYSCVRYVHMRVHVFA